MSGASSPAPIPGSRTSSLRRLYRVSYAPVVPLRPGALLADKYRIGGMLGEGGMGAVYQAVRATDGALVAVKVMRSEHAIDATMAERFEREAEMGGRIRSPHVSAIHDFGRADDGTMYLVMELLRGRSLYRYMDEKIVLPWREAVQVARQVALALAAVHEAGVIHRDLKPDNVFLCDDGPIKLLDFGIAKEWVPGWEKGKVTGKPLTQAGIVVGTPLYMSPEAVTQSPLGPPTDLYALGAILFEMVTGRLLFEEEEAVILMGHQLRTKPDRIRAVRPDLSLPEPLDALVDRLLAKSPAKRPQSAREVLAELDQIEAQNRPKGTAPFVAISPKAARRAAALVPTELTHLTDTTLPNGPGEDPMAFDDASMDEPTHLEVLPRGAAPTPPERGAAYEPSALPATTAETAPVTEAAGRPPALRMAGGAAVVGGLLLLGVIAAVLLRPSPPVVVSPVPTPAGAPDLAHGPDHVTEVTHERGTHETGTHETGTHETVPEVIPPSNVTVRFEITPAGARVSEGGVAIDGDVLVLPQDGVVHEYLIEARGRAPQRVRVEATEDRTVRVTLRPRSGGTSMTGGTEGTGGTGDLAREF